MVCGVDSGMVVIAASASTSTRRQCRQGKARLELGVAERRRRRDAGRDGAGERGREPARARAEPFEVVERVAAVVGLADQHPAPRADERADVVGQPPPGGRVQDVQDAADEHVGVAADVVAQDAPRVGRGHVERPERDGRCARALRRRRAPRRRARGRRRRPSGTARQRPGEPPVAAADVDDGQRRGRRARRRGRGSGSPPRGRSRPRARRRRRRWPAPPPRTAPSGRPPHAAPDAGDGGRAPR